MDAFATSTPTGKVAFRTLKGTVLAKVGDGLYLKKQGKVYDGSGLLLGPNSLFKNIRILGMLL